MSPLRSRSPVFLIASLLVAGAAYASTPGPFPNATPESQGIAAESVARLRDAVRGFVERGDIVGG